MFTQALVMLIGTLVILFTTNFQLTLVVLPLLPIALVLFMIFGRLTRPLLTEVQVRLSWLNTILQENLAGIKVIKAFVREPEQERRFDKSAEDVMQQLIKVSRFFIRFGRPDATDEEVFAAAKLAHADDSIQRLPDGYNTILGEHGAGLSHGQRQLLAIARAALTDPKVLILDEATSSVDTRAERLIQKALEKLLLGRTSFVIAHRLSTIRNADQVLVIEHGEIVERGTHTSLLAKKGAYYALYMRQFRQEENGSGAVNAVEPSLVAAT